MIVITDLSTLFEEKPHTHTHNNNITRGKNDRIKHRLRFDISPGRADTKSKNATLLANNGREKT